MPEVPAGDYLGRVSQPTPKQNKLDQAAARAALVDEIGVLSAELDPLKPKLKRLELLRASLRASYEPMPAADSFEANGLRYVVMVGPCGNQTIVDTLKLYKLIGWKAFLKLVSVTLKAVKENVSAEIQMQCISESLLTGPRSLTVLPKGVPA